MWHFSSLITALTAERDRESALQHQQKVDCQDSVLSIGSMEPMLRVGWIGMRSPLLPINPGP